MSLPNIENSTISVYANGLLPNADVLRDTHQVVTVVKDRKAAILGAFEGLAPMATMGAASLAKIGPKVGMAGGTAVGAVASIAAAKHEASVHERDLQNQFGSQAAIELGIVGRAPTAKEIKEYEKRHDMLRTEQINIVNGLRHHVAGSVLGGLASMGGMALGVFLLPEALAVGAIGFGAGTIGAAAASFGAGAIGSVAAGFGANAALNAIDPLVKPNETGLGAIKTLAAGLANGAPATTEGVFAVFALGDKTLAKEIKKKTGHPFPTTPLEDMTGQEKAALAAIVAAHPKVRDASAQFAQMINAGKMTPEMLVNIDLGQATGRKPVTIASRHVKQQPETPAARDPHLGKFAAAEEIRRMASTQANTNQAPGLAV